MRERKFFKKIASFVLALAMILVAIPAVEAKAATNVTVHFKNTENWSKVYSYTWGTAGELFGSWPGSETTVDSANEGYYVATVEGYEDSVMNIIFNDGNGVQTVDLVIGTAQSSEWWIVPTGAGSDGKFECAVATSKADAEAGTSTPVEMPEAPKNEIVNESIVYNGNEVTFYYEDATASKVEIAGSFNGWTMVEMTKDGNVYSYTTTLEAGSYEYKFIVDGSNWKEDPLNPAPEGDKHGNSVFEVTGEGGTTNEPADTPTTGEVTYTVYAYSATEARVSVDAAALWVWDLAGGGEGTEVAFTGTEEIDGKTWLKAEVKIAPTTEVGFIFKSVGTWDWQTSDLAFADAESKGATIYIVDGHAEIYTAVEDIEFDPVQAPADTEDKKDDTNKKDENDKKDETPADGDDLTIVWVIVVVIILAAAVVAVIVYKKLTAVPVDNDDDDDDDDDEVEEVAEEATEETTEEVVEEAAEEKTEE